MDTGQNMAPLETTLELECRVDLPQDSRVLQSLEGVHDLLISGLRITLKYFAQIFVVYFTYPLLIPREEEGKGGKAAILSGREC